VNLHKLSQSRRSQMSVIDLVNNNLLFRDPPAHTRLRSLGTRAFTNRNLAGMQGSLEKYPTTCCTISI
tara:strand:+ start:570 stop:773 length:204 start_codon:yes stop_codon:yes gene_type:complete